MTTEEYKKIYSTIPDQPGVYRFIAADGTIIYVGKAKVLKNRLASYFGEKKHQMPKTRVMVKNAHHFEYTIVESEQDALLLEASLIKKHQPRYNIALKDGKSHPYVVIKNERFPRVFITRRIIRDGSYYFGPYTMRWQLEEIMDLVKQLFPLRTCPLNLSADSIAKGKHRVCLEYHVKNCQGPCAGYESEEHYNEKIVYIKHLLKGNFANISKHLKAQMQTAAENLEFETAQRLKQRLNAFENYQAKSTVVNPNIHNIDVFSFEKDEKMAYINYLKVANGAIINTYTLELTPQVDEEDEDVLLYGVRYLVEKFNSAPVEILVPFEISLPPELKDAKVTVPKVGDKKKLLDLSEKNIKYYALQKKKMEASREEKMTSSERILTTMKKDLQLDELPIHLECFDNSNIQGTHAVSACVVFKNAKPSKRDYRIFNVKTVVGPDDFATMEEVVYRRYKRLLAEGQPLPQLILIDGGKGQLASAVKSLKQLGIYERVAIIGIAKRLEELYYPDDPTPLMLSKKSETLKVLQQARDEAHRFGITHHRDRRSRNFTVTELTKIKGIGSKIAEKLLTDFGSVKQVLAASDESLTAAVGKNAVAKIRAFFAAEQEDNDISSEDIDLDTEQ